MVIKSVILAALSNENGSILTAASQLLQRDSVVQLHSPKLASDAERGQSAESHLLPRRSCYFAQLLLPNPDQGRTSGAPASARAESESVSLVRSKL